VMNFVDVLVHGTPVEKLMGYRRANVNPSSLAAGKRLRTEEMKHVFVNEEKRDLERNISPSREGDLPGAHSKTLRNWVKQPNLGQDVRT
jgi:hypothetical protein